MCVTPKAPSNGGHQLPQQSGFFIADYFIMKHTLETSRVATSNGITVICGKPLVPPWVWNPLGGISGWRFGESGCSNSRQYQDTQDIQHHPLQRDFEGDATQIAPSLERCFERARIGAGSRQARDGDGNRRRPADQMLLRYPCSLQSMLSVAECCKAPHARSIQPHQAGNRAR